MIVIWFWEFIIKHAMKLIIALIVLIAVIALWGVTMSQAANIAIGDSIGLGTGKALGIKTYAQVNLGSCEIERRWTPRTATRIVVSAGINDSGKCVFGLRSRLKAKRVTWIIPAAINHGQKAVWAAVDTWGDGYVLYSCAGGCTKTNFHPESYAKVAAAVRRDWRAH